MGPDGVPLDHGRTVRLFPAHVRRAAEVRDGGCVFAGCRAPPWWCDVHHLLAWIDGGATNLGNAALLRERHHTQVHHGFRVERQPDGRWRTWRPDGSEIVIGPHRTGPPRTGPPLVTAARPDDDACWTARPRCRAARRAWTSGVHRNRADEPGRS
jgi:hypothetical protein